MGHTNSTSTIEPQATPAHNSTQVPGGNFTLPGNSTGIPEGNFTLPTNMTHPGINGTVPSFNMTNPTMSNTTQWQAWNLTKNTTDAFSAASVINSLSLADFCSTLLGYTTPVTTSTIPVTITQEVDVTVTAGTLTSGTTDTTTTVPTTITITSADPAWADLRKRSVAAPLTTPAPLATFGDAAVSQACSWKAAPVNVTSTVSVTTTDTAYTTVYITVPEATVPATTETLSVYSTATVNTCEPTAPSQLMKNPSFECYKSGWDVDYNGAFLYWGPGGEAAPELDAEAQAYIDTVNASSSLEAGQPSGGDPNAARLARRQSNSHPYDPTVVTPCEPAYDGNTYVRLRPAAIEQESAGLGQNMGNLDAGDYWMAYKYRVPDYALNNEMCSLSVYINNIPVQGPAIPSLTDPTDGWARAGGFFSIPEELAGPSYTYFDFYCPPLFRKSKAKRQDTSATNETISADSDWTSMCEHWSPPQSEPLLDIDYIRMGIDEGGWTQYRGAQPSEDDADAATVAADIANSPVIAEDPGHSVVQGH